MRKDVKFGLTVGAILLATLAVYVIVLSRGGAGTPGNPDVSSATGSGETDATAAPTDNTSAAPVDKAATASPNSDTVSNSTATASPADSGGSTTQPSATADAAAPSADWNNLLNHGQQVKLLSVAAPEHTETPTIDKSAASAAALPPQVSLNTHPAMIDAPPTTQPYDFTQNAIAAAPTLSAPTIAMPAAPTASSPTRIGGSRTHVIARGETLSAISTAVYGNSRYYTRILAANPGVDPRHLKIGATLVIPEPNGEKVDASSAAPSASATAVVDPSKGYTVTQGDSLEKIATKLYGDAHMADKIYDANKGLIGPDEDRLKIGWVLKLPQPPTSNNAPPAGVTASAHQ
jgi:nucleoid-associated protein YgaU